VSLTTTRGTSLNGASALIFRVFGEVEITATSQANSLDATPPRLWRSQGRREEGRRGNRSKWRLTSGWSAIAAQLPFYCSSLGQSSRFRTCT